jgi:hypothetical protein
VSPLDRRIAKIEQRRGAATCPECGGKGPGGLRFFLPGQTPTPVEPCPRCGREDNTINFIIRVIEPRPKPAPAA